MRDAYIVTSIRTPGCKKGKGAFKDTRPDDLLAFILRAAVEKTVGLNLGDVDDIIVGCAFPEAEQGLNLARMACQIAGFPESVPGVTVNRFCSAGLEAISSASLKVMAGWADIAIGAGVESMTYVPMGGNLPRPNPEYSELHGDLYASMGITAENVANRYGISRKDQDSFAFDSHIKAAKAQNNNLFTEIVPTPATRYLLKDDVTYSKDIFLQKYDDGIRSTTTVEGLAKLRPVFALNGSVTAGNSSQTTDGAAASVVMSEVALKRFGIKPVAKFKLCTTIGCKADEMGVGPAVAVPKLLEMSNLKVDDIGLWEINEAFASQALYSIRSIGIEDYMARINVNGGAIALGHPLGCTGAKLCSTLLANMRFHGVRYGIETMCIGGGMGAAALFELCD